MSPGQTGGYDAKAEAATGRTASPTYTRMLRTQFKYDPGYLLLNLGPNEVPLTPLFINMNCTNAAGCGLELHISIAWGPYSTAGSLLICVTVDATTPVCRYDRADSGYYTSGVMDAFTPVTFGTHAVKVTGDVLGAPGWYRVQSVARYTLYAP